MKKIILLVVSLCVLFALTACGQPEINGYHIDENGKLIATYEDNTTADLGTLTDTIANGANTISVNSDGFYVINGVVSKIEANLPVSYEVDTNGNLIVTYTDTTKKNLGKFGNDAINTIDSVSVSEDGFYILNGIETTIEAILPESYAIDTNGNLIVTYTDSTTENLGKFGNDAINTIDTIAISDDGFYVLNGIKTSIVAVDVFDVKFATGYDATVKTQIVKDGDKVTRPQLERDGYTLKGWYCNGEEWRFNSDVVLNEMTLTAEWLANDYTISFNTGISGTLPNQTITFNSEYTLPTLERTGYTFKGWEYNSKLVTANEWNIADNATLDAKWEVNKYTVALNANGGTVARPSVEVTYGEEFALPVATNEYGAFIGWFYGETQITDSQGNSLENWTYLTDIEATTSWTIKVSNANDLQQLYLYPNGHFELTQNIDISLTEWVPVGTDSKPFTGEINGCGFAINGLKITSLQDNLQAYGFIGVAKEGKIYDIAFTNINISLPAIQNTVYVGGVIGRNYGASLDNILTTGNITIANHSTSYDSYAGGIAGWSYVDTFSNCKNETSISAKTIAGGIVGYRELNQNADYGAFVNNSNFGTITAYISGGIIGDGIFTITEKCFNTGSVCGTKFAGGIVGRSFYASIVDQCYNTGNVCITSTSPTQFDAAGGIIGSVVMHNEYLIGITEITNSYNQGNIDSKKEAGGIIGSCNSAGVGKVDIQNCYNSGNIKGVDYAGGIGGAVSGISIKQCINHGTISNATVRATLCYPLMNPTIADCYYSCGTSGIDAIQGTKITEKYSDDFYTQTLFWSGDVWIFYNDKLPTLK